MMDRPTITLRRACRDDSADLLAWRNDPDTRANSRNTAEVARASHESWLDGVLNDANRLLWIVERGGQKIGTVSAVRTALAEVELSITVAPTMRGRGESGGMIRAAILETRAVWPDAVVRAAVRVENMASRRLFERCGFHLAGEDRGLLVYRLIDDD